MRMIHLFSFSHTFQKNILFTYGDKIWMVPSSFFLKSICNIWHMCPHTYSHTHAHTHTHTQTHTHAFYIYIYIYIYVKIYQYLWSMHSKLFYMKILLDTQYCLWYMYPLFYLSLYRNDHLRRQIVRTVLFRTDFAPVHFLKSFQNVKRKKMTPLHFEQKQYIIKNKMDACCKESVLYRVG